MVNGQRKDISKFRLNKAASFDDLGKTIRGENQSNTSHNLFVSTDRGNVAGDVIHAIKTYKDTPTKDKKMLIGGSIGLLGSIGAMTYGYHKTPQHLVAEKMTNTQLAKGALKDVVTGLGPMAIGGQMIIDGIDKGNHALTAGGVTVGALGALGAHSAIKSNTMFTNGNQRNLALLGAVGTSMVYPAIHTLSRASQNLDDDASIDSIVADRNLETKQKIRELAKVKNGVGARRAMPFFKYFGFTDKLEPIVEKLQHNIHGDSMYQVADKDKGAIFDKLKNEEINKAIQEFKNVKHRAPSTKEFESIEKNIDSMILEELKG